MTKAEMRLHNDAYESQVARSRKAYVGGEYRAALEFSRASWPHVDGMIRYQRKEGGRESVSIDGIAAALDLAPLLLDITILDDVRLLLKNDRRILKYCSDDLTSLLSAAEELLWNGYHLWDLLEASDLVQQSELRTLLGGSQDQWRRLAETWCEMGFVSRSQQGSTYQLRLTSRMDQNVDAKCPICGAIATAEKSTFLDNAECPTCHKNTVFVLVAGNIVTR